MDNITFGKYIPLNSFIHNLDPRQKIITLMFAMTAIFFDIGFIGYSIIAMYVLLVVLLSKIQVSHILKAVKPMIFMMIFLMIFNIFLLRSGDVLFTIFSLPVYSGAIIQSVLIFIRIVLIISLTTILTSSTKPLALTLAIESLLNPLKKIKFPSHELAMMISIALRFIPDLLDETKRIMKAQASRGVDFNEGTLKEKIRAIISLIIPLFISAFQRAEDLANAMESRNYNPEATRTRFQKLSWKNNDTISLAFSIIVCVGVVVMSFVLW